MTPILPTVQWLPFYKKEFLFRFNEFPNEGSHCLYVTCVELMSIPDKPATIGEKLIDVVLQVSENMLVGPFLVLVSIQTHSHIPPDKLPEWINAVGLLVSNLPEAFWAGLHNKLEASLDCAPLADWNLGYTPTQVRRINVTEMLSPTL